MIPMASVHTIMQAASASVGVIAIQGNQTGPRPDYPFIRYSVIADNVERIHQNAKTNSYKLGDDTTVERTRHEQFDASLSITGVDSANQDGLRALMGGVHDWFGREEAEDLLYGLNLVATFAGSVQNRTAMLEPFYEHQLGFDVRLVGRRVLVDEMEAVKTVTLGETVDGSVRDDIIITV